MQKSFAPEDFPAVTEKYQPFRANHLSPLTCKDKSI